MFNVIWTSYLALSLTDPALDMGPLAWDADAVVDVVAAQLRAAQAWAVLRYQRDRLLPSP
jgi:hypothetical protein